MEKIYKTIAAIGPSLRYVDTIKHDGKYWVVTGWRSFPDAGFEIPERIIALDSFPHQVLTDNPRADFALNTPIPIEILSGPVPPELEGKYLVKDHPDIRFYFPKGIH